MVSGSRCTLAWDVVDTAQAQIEAANRGVRAIYRSMLCRETILLAWYLLSSIEPTDIENGLADTLYLGIDLSCYLWPSPHKVVPDHRRNNIVRSL